MSLQILKEKYDMDEEDFLSAELEIVPAPEKQETCGFDRSMILSYGQDDRVCAFTSLFCNDRYCRGKENRLLSSCR